MDSTTIREIPPLRAAWALRGEQAHVPIIGSHHKQILLGVLNILTGTYLATVSTTFNQTHFQTFLQQIRAYWRGWHIILFLDKASAHTAAPSQALAQQLRVELRWLPTACPELNVMDCLWRHTKDTVVANEPTPHLETTVARVLAHLEALSGHERLTKAGVLAEHFWLADVRQTLLSN